MGDYGEPVRALAIARVLTPIRHRGTISVFGRLAQW